MDNQRTNQDVLLSVRDLEVQYLAGGETVRAVNGVSFDVMRGQTFGLVGETGAGKTTIAKSILRYCPIPRQGGGRVYRPGRTGFIRPVRKADARSGQKILRYFQGL